MFCGNNVRTPLSFSNHSNHQPWYRYVVSVLPSTRSCLFVRGTVETNGSVTAEEVVITGLKASPLLMALRICVCVRRSTVCMPLAKWAHFVYLLPETICPTLSPLRTFEDSNAYWTCGNCYYTVIIIILPLIIIIIIYPAVSPLRTLKRVTLIDHAAIVTRHEY